MKDGDSSDPDGASFNIDAAFVFFFFSYLFFSFIKDKLQET